MSNTAIQVRARITQAEYRELRSLAALKGLPVSQLVADVLRTAPATRKAFQTKETKQ